MPTKYQILNEFQGYVNKPDITNITPGHLVVGSQNMLLNDAERLAVRGGYTLDGQANTATTPIESSFDWVTRPGTKRYVRAYDDELEFRFVDSDGVITWNRLQDSFTSVAFNFATFWDTTELIEEMLFVNGTSNIFQWSGAITTFASDTSNTLTKEGSTSWAEEGFYIGGTRQVTLNDVVYTYTGGETTMTLTGVTPDPTLTTNNAGDVIHQTTRTTANSAITDLPNSLENDLISNLLNQIWIGSFSNRQVLISKQNDFLDFGFSSPRLVGEGGIINIDSVPTAFIVQEENMFISAGDNDWYKVFFEVGSTITQEALFVRRLKTTAQEGAQSQALVSKMPNEVVFISQEPVLSSLGRVKDELITQTSNLSDPIKLEFNASDFTNGDVRYFQNNLFISAPNDGLVFILNLDQTNRKERPIWEAPQVLPISKFAIIDGDLYGHSADVPETYKLFTGTSDNGGPIKAVARLSFQNGGDRVNFKAFTEFYSEGYLTSNTTIDLKIIYDFNGSSGTKSYTIKGTDTKILFDDTGDGSLGKESLGKRSFAGRGSTVDPGTLPKFRQIDTFAKVDHFEFQTEYSSNDIDFTWELLAFGPNGTISTNKPTQITK